MRERERERREGEKCGSNHSQRCFCSVAGALSLSHTHTATHGVMELHPFSHLTYGFSGEGSCGDLKKKQLARH